MQTENRDFVSLSPQFSLESIGKPPKFQLTQNKDKMGKAEYMKREMNDLRKTGKQTFVYEMKRKGTVSYKDFLRIISLHHPGLTEGTIMSAIATVADELVHQLSDGYAVNIDGLGTFSAGIGIRKEKKEEYRLEEEEYNARSMEVNKVTFRACKKLVNQVNRECALYKGAESHIKESPYTKEERLQILKDYLSRPNSIGAHISDYANLVGLSNSTAGRELLEFSHDPASGITSVGKRASKVYILNIKD